MATNLRAYGTDGEITLFEAAADAFPFAIHIRCVNHFSDNVTEYLRKQLLPDCVVKEIVNDCFGTSNEKGLLHSTAVEFDLKLSILEQKWEKLCSHNVFTWFKKKVAPVIRENMREELLHSLDDKYTQNNSESLNALVKRFVLFKKQDLATFVSDLEECVLEQQLK